MNALKTIGRNAVLFAIGGTIYYMIELIWRGYSSLPMVLVGGLCFLFCGSINEFLDGLPAVAESGKKYIIAFFLVPFFNCTNTFLFL